MGKARSGKGKGAERTAVGLDWPLDPALPVLADSIAEAVLVLGAGGDLRVANGRFEELADQAGAAADGGGWLAVLAPADRARAQALWIEAAEAQAARKATLGLLSGGQAVCRVAPVGLEGRLLGWVVTVSPNGPEEERAALRLALARSEERLARTGALLREAEERRVAEGRGAEQARQDAERRAAEAEAALHEAGRQLDLAEDRLRKAAAALAFAEERRDAAEVRQDELEARMMNLEARASEAMREAHRPTGATPAEGTQDLSGPEPQQWPGSVVADTREPSQSPPVMPVDALPSPAAPPPAEAVAPSPEDDAEIDAVLGRLRSEALREYLTRWRDVPRDGIAPRSEIWESHIAGDAGLAEDHRIGEGAGTHGAPSPGGAAAASTLGRVLAKSGVSDAAWRRCAETARPVHEFAGMSLGPGISETHERLLLPFSSDGRRVDHVLSFVAISGSPLVRIEGAVLD